MSNLIEEMLSNSNFSTNRKTQDTIVSVIHKTRDTDNKIYTAIDMLRAKDSASFDDFIKIMSDFEISE